jgi:hypothetical protein
MNVLISNILTPLIEDAIQKTSAGKVIFVHETDKSPQVSLPYDNILINENPTDQLVGIMKSILDSGDNVQFALEPNSTGLEILNTAKKFEQFRKISMYIVKDNGLEHFKACLC